MSVLHFRRYTLVALVFFLIASVFGVILRAAFAIDLPPWINYKYLQHGHSHVAMMGWVYNVLYILILYFFPIAGKKYRRLFWISQIGVLGMMLSFPAQGYGPLAIVFTTWHLLCSYVFIYFVFKDLRGMPKSIPLLMLKTALIFLFVSSLGTWALAFIMNSGLRGSAFYYGSIQFYLHYQFNGWMIFGALAVFFKYLEHHKIEITSRRFFWFYRLMVVSCIMTFALAVSWSTPDKLIFWTNSIGVLIQLAALITFFYVIAKVRLRLKEHLLGWTHFLLVFSFVCLSIKIVTQALVAIPHLAVISYTIRNFVVGFIHLIMLGLMTSFALAMILQLLNRITVFAKVGIVMITLAFLSTEILLFGQGLLVWAQKGFLPNYHHIITICSLLFPVGLLFFLTSLSLEKADD